MKWTWLAVQDWSKLYRENIRCTPHLPANVDVGQCSLYMKSVPLTISITNGFAITQLLNDIVQSTVGDMLCLVWNQLVWNQYLTEKRNFIRFWVGWNQMVWNQYLTDKRNLIRIKKASWHWPKYIVAVWELSLLDPRLH